MIYLLDANVLIALIDTTHAHHAAALRFFPITLLKL
jgi:predicted nucleic acid-binding protein